MESKTLAVFDSTLWLIRVGVAVALFIGSLSGTAYGRDELPYPHLEAPANLKVQLLRKLPDRKGRKLEIVTDTVYAVGQD